MRDWQLSRTFGSSAGEVRWECWGQGEEPLVLLHGTPFSSFVWRGVVRSLAPHYRVYVWDMPGYGQSEKSDGQDVSLGAQGRVFAELLGHWGLQRPLVAAHDFGGTVALRAHLLLGAAYRRLALVDPVALAPWGSAFFRLVGEHVGVFTRLPPAMHRALVREYVRSASAAGLHEPVLDRLVQPWSDEVGQAAFYRQIAQADERYTDEIEELYGTLDLPVGICWGGEDSWIPARQGHRLAGMIPGATLRVLPGAGHLVQEDAPAELAAALFAFLGDVH